MNARTAVVLCAALAPFAAGADSPYNYVAAYFNMSSQSGLVDDDGNGYGVRGAAMFTDNLFFQGEYQSTSLDNGGDDAQVMRIGGGFTPATREDINFSVSAEYLQADQLGNTSSGYGVHGGVMFRVVDRVKGFGEVGYVDISDYDGPEYLVGALYEFAPRWDVFADYRITDYGGELGDLKYGDIQAGIRFDFGGAMTGATEQ